MRQGQCGRHRGQSAYEADRAVCFSCFDRGDVIVEVQNQPVKTPADIEARVDADAKAGKKAALMLVNRNGDLTYVGLRLD